MGRFGGLDEALLGRVETVVEGADFVVGEDLFGVEAEDLEAGLVGSAGEGDVGLALFEHFGEIDFDAFEGLALRFVDGEGPGENEWDLSTGGLDFAVGEFDFPGFRGTEEVASGAVRQCEFDKWPSAAGIGRGSSIHECFKLLMLFAHFRVVIPAHDLVKIGPLFCNNLICSLRHEALDSTQ